MKPLRGSVRQNTLLRQRPPQRGFFYKARLALITGLAGLLFVAGLWFWLSGGPARLMRQFSQTAIHASQKAQFAIGDILVEGRHHTEKEELLAALGVNLGDPVFAFDPVEALAKIRELPWVNDAVVERRLPDTIYVSLKEREPLARWQHNNKTVVIDREGKELPDASLEAFAGLPLVVGSDAPSQTEALLTALKDFPAVSKLMKAAVRVGERRWNLYLQATPQREVIVRFPEDGLAAELKRLDKLIREEKILERNAESLDLRFSGRLILDPAKAAAPGQPEESRP
ncbi:MAG: FtsQ-type POTRA domain-containing protein [Alphaproteobacteria bacterium]|nr:FtsQ-type POTRA domain-containing protein [Alphaproteobacteria bacterium]